MSNEEIIRSIATRNATRKVIRGKFIGKTIIIILLILTAFLLGVFGSTKVLLENSDFSVSVIDPHTGSLELGGQISLSETGTFEDATVSLSGEGIDGLWNTSYVQVLKTLTDAPGSHNGENYIAYTFYLKNVGSKAIISENIYINSVLKHVDDAIRVKVYRNNDETIYAKANANGVVEADADEMFYSDVSVCYNEFTVDSDETIKYTVLIWLEGNDPECTNSISGGKISLGMEIKVKEDETL